ncbi:hypothetical protein [Streptomyces avicenniae]|uniref:hypothetical protein n=1 Tax=Streptomyces avicenniae TaxID=500153 RepID=UPI001CBA669B|nr:hypothetical protein [Streptomyces avicenniae]
MAARLRGHAARELTLAACLLRWAARRGPHGVEDGGLPVPYARQQTGTLFVLLFVCAAETVATAFLIPWPVVHAVALALGLWGCWFVVALHASCVVRPHVIGADGSLRLRYGALLDIRVPADRIGAVLQDRAFTDTGPGAVDGDGVADLAVAGQTTVTVQLTAPVAYTRVLGRPAAARVFRFHADDPLAAVAALRAASGRS